jgi:hypothetical protein
VRVFCAIAALFFPLSAVAQSPENPTGLPQVLVYPETRSNMEKLASADQIPSNSIRSGLKENNADTRKSVCLMVEAAARSNGLPVEFFTRVIWQESRFRSDAVGPSTRSGRQAQGIAQFMPGTALDRNLLNPFDPVQALPKAAEFLRDLRTQFGNRGLAAAAYNAGPRRVREWITGTGSMPLETRNYVQSITGMSIDAWAKHGGDSDEKIDAGPACDQLMALLKRAPNPFVEALEERIVSGSTQPWTVILTAGFSRAKILDNYTKVQQSHIALHGYDAFITQIRLRSRGPIPFYQVRIGVPDRSAAYRVCGRIRLEHGACVILRPPRA